jgi:adenine deaminase
MRDALVDAALGYTRPDVVIRGGQIINVLTHECYPADVMIKGERIAAVGDSSEYDLGNNCILIDASGEYLSPGFMDPHFHIESSSITVTELAKLIVPRGVTMVAQDPHDFASVLGFKGIELLFQEGHGVPLNFLLRVPGRVPVMNPDSDTAGSTLSMDETKELLGWPEALCLAGDINPVLILQKDQAQYEKIDYTIRQKMTVSGQAPGLKGKELNAFVAAGLEDSHVSASVEEVLDDLRHGLKVLLTHRPTKFMPKDFAKLAAVIRQHGLDTRNILLCTDDTHANQLLKEGHLEYRIKLAIENGIDPITALQMATINVAEFYRITRDYGSISPGKYADIVTLNNLESVKADKVFIHGKLVAENGCLVSPPQKFIYPKFAKQTMHLRHPVEPGDLMIFSERKDQATQDVQVAILGTPKELRIETLSVEGGVIMPDLSRGIVSMAMVERHKATGNVGKGFIEFPLIAGAYASSMSHDSHNIFVIGANFEDMSMAVNRVAMNQGGYVVVKSGKVLSEIEMPIAGLLSEEPFDIVAHKMEEIEFILREELGCTIPYRPFYFLNLFCLPNIPNVGITDKGVISSRLMAPVNIVVQEKD